jgi:uncharacterized protein (TIGR00730 family)
MASLIDSLLEDLAQDTTMSPERRELMRELLARVVMVAESDAHTKDLKVAVTAIDELLDAFSLFDNWREQPKVTVFGSARTAPNAAVYQLTVELAHALAERGWIIVSGAGPGIMEAASEGAGIGNTLGVNIELPFEQDANPYIDPTTRLVTMKYFFTRKVALTRSSVAFVVLPGGLGTMDELFEVLTLLDTGKTTPAPVVLLDTPGGQFWKQWMTFLEDAIVANNYVGPLDMCLVRLTTSVADSLSEIEHFYSNYRDFDVAGERGVMALHHGPTDEQLQQLRVAMPQFDTGDGYRKNDDESLSFDFDGRNYVGLRQVIDIVNSWPA